MPLPNIIKICQTIMAHTQELDIEIISGEVTRKQQMQALSVLHVTHLLVNIHVSTKYYQNIPNH